MTIKSIQIRAGEVPWTQAQFNWEGTSAVWTLRDTVHNRVIYTGSDKEFLLDVLPQTLYKFELSGDVSPPEPAHYVTPPMGSPAYLTPSAITPDSALLTWTTVPGATSYEIANVHDSYAVIATAGAVQELTLNGLDPVTTYVIAIRAVLGGIKSLWSPAVNFTTGRTGTVKAGDLSYEPIASATWTTGRGWRGPEEPLVHGSGEQFDDASGINTTFFFFSDEHRAMFTELRESEVTAIRVFLKRFPETGDPRATLSHWFLHNHLAKPPGAPTVISDGVDVGLLMLDEGDWIELPVDWARRIVDGLAAGIAWGGVSDRYQVAPKPENMTAADKNGELRITVM